MSRLDRYQNPELYELLCGEYVLGTMTGRVRRRFEQLIDERDYLQESVAVWERRLYPLAENIPPLTPHRRVWANIKKEIAFSNIQPHRSEKGLWNKLFLWRSVAFAALSLCAILLIQQFVVPNDGSSPMPSYISVLEADNRVPMFVATASRQSSSLIIKRMDSAGMSMNKDLELWCYMKEGDRPWSMGILTRKEQTVLPLTEHDWKTMAETRRLAISIEPMGGSPTGSPTGPVMYKGDFVSLI
jgi:anti-sigma-K factor RskA